MAVLRNDLSDDMVFPQMHTGVSGAGDGTCHAHFPGAVMGEKPGTENGLTGIRHTVRACVPTYKSTPQAFFTADSENTQKLHRHADKTVRLFPVQNIGIFLITHSRAQLQRLCAEAYNGFCNQLTQAEGTGKRKTDHDPVTGENQFSQTCHIETNGIFQVTLCIENPLRKPGRTGSRI